MSEKSVNCEEITIAVPSDMARSAVFFAFITETVRLFLTEPYEIHPKTVADILRTSANAVDRIDGGDANDS